MHNHNDRGALHSDCLACSVLRNIADDAGIDITGISLANPDTYLDTDTQQFRPATFSISFADDRPDLDVAGEEMGNKAVIDQQRHDARTNPIRSFWQAMSKMANTAKPPTQAGQMALSSLCFHMAEEHLSDGHLDFLFETLPRLSLGAAQQLHGALHLAGIGHHDSAEHMVPPPNEARVAARARLADQKAYSEQVRAAKAQRHAERLATASQRRHEVQLESARALQRAITHADGTIGNRTELVPVTNEIRAVIGANKPITLAKVSIDIGGHQITGVGTALCKPGDTWNLRIGYRLALGRALRALGHQVEADGFHLDTQHSR